MANKDHGNMNNTASNEDHSSEAEKIEQACNELYDLLEYALSTDMKNRYLEMPKDQEAMQLLLALGGSILLTFQELDLPNGLPNLVKDFKYLDSEQALQEELDGVVFKLAKNPMQVLEAGLQLGVDVDENLFQRFIFGIASTILVYSNDELCDIFDVYASENSAKRYDCDGENILSLDKAIETAEEKWSKKHGIRFVTTEVSNIMVRL